MAQRAILAGAGPVVLTADQRVRLASIMNDYLHDAIVVEHFLAHGGGASIGAGASLHSFNSHRELVMALEDYLQTVRDAGDPRFLATDPFLPAPAHDPTGGIPDDSAVAVGGLTFRQVRAPDDPTLAPPPWPTPTPGPPPAPPCSPGQMATPTFFPPPTVWPALVDFSPFVPFPGDNFPADPCSASGVNNASDLWNTIGSWHLHAHDHIGGSMSETPLDISGGCYRTEPFRQAAPVFLPFHAFIDEVYWNYQHCAGHGIGPALAVPGWFGQSSQGGAIDIADVNASGKWDLIVAHVDHSGASNQFFYRILRDLDTSGNAVSLINPVALPDPIGSQTQGCGVAVANVRGATRSPTDSALDLIALWVEVDGLGVKHGRYRVGWNLDPNTGQPRGDGTHPQWSAVMTVFDPFTGAGNPDVHGVGIAVGKMTTPSMRLVVFRVEQQGGVNKGWYQIGKLSATNGTLSSWTGDQAVALPAAANVPPGLEDDWFTQDVAGADVTIADTHGDGLIDMIFFYVGSVSGSTKRGYFRIAYHVDADTGAPEATHGYFDQSGSPHGWGRIWTIPVPGPGSFTEMSTRPVDRVLATPADFGAVVHGAGVAFVGGFTNATLTGQPSYSLRPWPPTHPFSGSSPTQGDLIFFHLEDPSGGGSNRGYYRVGHALDINGEFS